MTAEEKMERSRCWLPGLIIIISLFLLNHFFNAFDYFYELFYPEIDFYNLLPLFIFSSIVTIVAGVALFYGLKRKKQFPQFAIMLMWLSFVSFLLTNLNSINNEEGLSAGIGTLVGALLATIAWTRYIKESKRVKNTFIK
jgi:H+/Cl- antiporter ClcA